MTKIMRNVLVFYSSNGRERLRTSEAVDRDPPAPTWKRVLELCRSVQVALLGFDLEIAKYKAGGVEFTEPPAILDDPEFFEEPGDPEGE